MDELAEVDKYPFRTCDAFGWRAIDEDFVTKHTSCIDRYVLIEELIVVGLGEAKDGVCIGEHPRIISGNEYLFPSCEYVRMSHQPFVFWPI